MPTIARVLESPMLPFSEKKRGSSHLCFFQSDLNLQLRYLCPTLHNFQTILQNFKPKESNIKTYINTKAIHDM